MLEMLPSREALGLLLLLPACCQPGCSEPLQRSPWGPEAVGVSCCASVLPRDCPLSLPMVTVTLDGQALSFPVYCVPLLFACFHLLCLGEWGGGFGWDGLRDFLYFPASSTVR